MREGTGEAQGHGGAESEVEREVVSRGVAEAEAKDSATDGAKPTRRWHYRA